MGGGVFCNTKARHGSLRLECEKLVHKTGA